MAKLTFDEMAERLEDHFGTNAAVARALGISRRYYMKLLRGVKEGKYAQDAEDFRGRALQTRILMRIYCRYLGLSRTYRAFRKHQHEFLREWHPDRLKPGTKKFKKVNVRW